MAALLFFLAGLPAAYLAARLVERFSAPDEDPDDDEDDPPARRVLPWQVGSGPARVRWGVAALVPVFMAVAGWRFDAGQAAAVSLLVVALLVCTATDLIRFRVPNAVTYPGILLALVAAVFMPDADLKGALLAAAIVGTFFLVLALLSRGGLGLGDVKLAILIGAALGLPAAYQALFLGVLAAGVVMLLLFLAGVVGRREAVPYAPFLALAAVAVVLVEGAAFAPL